jgi:hypothetical protein
MTAMAREAIAELYDLFRDLDRRIACFARRSNRFFAPAKPASASQRSKASARRPPQPWSPLLATESDAGMSMIRGQYENRATKHRATDDVRQHGVEGMRCLDVSCPGVVAGWFRAVLMTLFINRPVSSATTLLNGSRACNPFLYT